MCVFSRCWLHFQWDGHPRNPRNIETFQGSKGRGGWGLKPGARPQGHKKSKKNTVGFEPGGLLPAPDCLTIELMTKTCDTRCHLYWPNNARLRTKVDKIMEHKSGLNHGFQTNLWLNTKHCPQLRQIWSGRPLSKRFHPLLHVTHYFLQICNADEK